ncbi:MAG: hypothetical protein AB1646_22670 [Thermodesulfobacteriota bacterium]
MKHRVVLAMQRLLGMWGGEFHAWLWPLAVMEVLQKAAESPSQILVHLSRAA